MVEKAVVKVTVEEQIYDLSLAGNTPKQIAVALQRPPQEIEAAMYQMAEASRRRLIAELSVADVLDLDRINVMLKALWPRCENGEGPAIDRALTLIQKRRDILRAGTLDRPKEDGFDLSVLSIDELKQLEKIQSKLAAKKASAIDVES